MHDSSLAPLLLPHPDGGGDTFLRSDDGEEEGSCGTATDGGTPDRDGLTTVRIPGAAEEVQAHFPNVIVNTQSQRAVADVFISNFRLVVMCTPSMRRDSTGKLLACHHPLISDPVLPDTPMSASPNAGPDDGLDGGNGDGIPGGGGKLLSRTSSGRRMEIESNLDLSQCVPLGLVSDVSLKVPKKSAKVTSSRAMHDSAIDAGAGDHVSKRSTLQLAISCRDFRTITITFAAAPEMGRRALHEQIRALVARLEFCIRNIHTQPPALALGCLNPGGWFAFDEMAEFVRQGAISGEIKDGLMTPWRMCKVNDRYQVSPTYPSLWIVPRCLDDETVKESAAFRSKGRLPILCYFNKKVGNSLVRCAQPKAGVTGRRSEADEFLVHAVRQSSPDPTMMVIFDARSSLAEMGNKLMGKGSEAKKNYRNTKMLYMEIANIHSVRGSADALQSMCEDGSEEKWLSRLEQTGWLRQVHSVLSAGCALARKMSNEKMSCLVHCSDGWDRTAQMTSLCQLLLDPYYRTIRGFCVLIEKEWLAFGHMFTNRTYAPHSTVERSPIFVLFLDCVWQIMVQFPHAFEFGERMLILLADHFQSGYFGNFLCDSERERLEFGLNRSTTALWSHIEAIHDDLVVMEYKEGDTDVLVPIVSMKRLALWSGYFLRHEFAATSSTDDLEDPDNQHNTIVWVPDANAHSCKDCGMRFTVVRRRHHCRACGRVFCNDCSKNRIALPTFGYEGAERVCDGCNTKHRWGAGDQRAAMYYGNED